mmetsp:Transcript_9510/g.14316  ORF Transcript_9510/g.14316 Transcript_9510/m.14316 type:complete len:116 (+) Transcript_9510:43-390(+)
MNKQLEQVRNVLNSLDALGSSVRGSSPPTPEDLLERINTYVAELKTLHDTGNTSNFPVPIDLLEFLESGDVQNPWLYMHKQFEECEEAASSVVGRRVHLEDVEKAVRNKTSENAT